MTKVGITVPDERLAELEAEGVPPAISVTPLAGMVPAPPRPVTPEEMDEAVAQGAVGVERR